MWLLLFIILLPFAELALLIEIGGRIGTLNVLVFIVLTAVVGVALARQAGWGVARRMQVEMASGRLPADALFDGALILLAGVGLLVPGFLTDLFGLLCLFPPTRGLFKTVIGRRLQKAARTGKVKMSVQVGGRTRAIRRERYGGRVVREDEPAGVLEPGKDEDDSDPGR